MAVLSAAKATGLVVDLHKCRGAYVEDVAEEQVLALTRLQRHARALNGCGIVTGCSCAAVQRIDGRRADGPARCLGQRQGGWAVWVGR
eukprot:9522251-Alexandrium_andersonii.AAC.1